VSLWPWDKGLSRWISIFLYLTFTPDCTFESPGELLKPTDVAESQWLMPVILATQEAEIRRIVV
jgi:hypothetical protein